MRQIQLSKIFLEQFKSFLQPVEINLTREPGLKYIGGENQVEPRLGSNGCGKSSIWDAVCWCFFNTAARGQKASDLTSWAGKRPRVQVCLVIDGKPCNIERIGSPNKIYINGEVAAQEDIQRLIGLTQSQFLQSVLFGQEVPLFLDMSATARGELLQGVLGLELWEALSDDASRQAALLGRQEADLDRELAFAKGKLDGIEDEAELQQQAEQWDSVRDAEMDALIDKIDGYEQGAQTDIKTLKAKQSELSEVADSVSLDQDIETDKECLRRVREINKQLDFYAANSACPTCHQPYRNIDHVMSLEDELAELGEEAEIIKSIDQSIEIKAGLNARRTRLLSEIARAESEISSANRYVGMLSTSVEKLAEKTNPLYERLDNIRQLRVQTEEMITALSNQKLVLKGKQLKYEYWKQGFKKVRLYQIKQVLLRLEIETANAASALGINWKIHFVTEVENKSGTMKQGVQVIFPNGKWELYSGGESQRIRLAVTLGLAATIQNMAGVDYQFEVFDEASQYLSVEGVDDLLTCLANRAETTKKSIWVVDHTALSFGGFSEFWSCIKDGSGSRMELVSRSN